MKGFFLFAVASILDLDHIQATVGWVLRALSLGIKWSVCEADHLLPSSAKFKNAWSYTSTCVNVFMA
jgi:hypothetical protein